MLAAYASRQNWHHLTVAASISASLWDNTLRSLLLTNGGLILWQQTWHRPDYVDVVSATRKCNGLRARSPVGARHYANHACDRKKKIHG